MSPPESPVPAAPALASEADGLAEALELGRATSVEQAAERALLWLQSHRGVGDALVVAGRPGGTRVVGQLGTLHETEEAVGRAEATILPASIDGVVAAPLCARDALIGVIAARGDDDLLPLLALAGQLLGVLVAVDERSTVQVDDAAVAEEVSILGESPALARALEQARLVAPTNSSVLILGESGTGKELMAAYIHEHSRRKGAPLVRTNCATIPADLFESEFFGHVRGAFTGAHKDREGRFAAADGGTLFLDEVGEIPIGLQAKLLRVLQEGTFERVGDSRTQRVDVRILAATNRDLLQLVEEGRFREDLYYRLSVFPVELPPLRDRGDDVRTLARRFIARAARRHGRPPATLSDAADKALAGHAWPGNVRELVNVVERAVIVATDGEIRPEHLALGGALGQLPAAAPAAGSDERVWTFEELRAFEKHNLELAMTRAGGQIGGAGGAAELVGIPASTFTSKLKAHGLK
jgi:transcriptional regulator with GAF, ATPase, and Fis domain